MKTIIDKWYVDFRNGELNYHTRKKESKDRLFTIRMSTRRSKVDSGYIPEKELNTFFKDINKLNHGRISLLSKAKLTSTRQRKILKLIFEKW